MSIYFLNPAQADTFREAGCGYLLKTDDNGGEYVETFDGDWVVNGALRSVGVEIDPAVMPCGCIDYHMADCDVMTGGDTYDPYADYDPYEPLDYYGNEWMDSY